MSNDLKMIIFILCFFGFALVGTFICFFIAWLFATETVYSEKFEFHHNIKDRGDDWGLFKPWRSEYIELRKFKRFKIYYYYYSSNDNFKNHKNYIEFIKKTNSIKHNVYNV